MCGIAGLLDLASGRADPARVQTLKRMTEAQRHRGPDDAGYLVAHPAYLGHRRLSILDLTPGGRQPMENEDGSIAVVFNGEIYNFASLRERLEAAGHTFRTRTDTEVLVHLYEDEGPDFLASLSGMFALALWDARQRRLLLARDRMGQKPLYYAWQAGLLAFASELDALLESRPSWRVDAHAVAKMLLMDAVPAPATIVEGARKLGPGERLVLQDGAEPVVERWWDVPYGPTHAYTDESDALARFDEVFVPAVERHLVSDVPLGLFLSGGLDSTAVLDAMARVKPVSEIRTFAVGFEEASFDESAFARDVAERVGTRHQTEVLGSARVLGLVPDAVDRIDEPLGDPSFVPTWLLSAFTRRSVTVALGGDGGDELFLGYPTFRAHDLARGARALLPPPLSRGLLALAHALVPVSARNVSLDYQLKRFLKGLGVGEWERHLLWFGAHPPDEQAALFRPGVLDAGFLAQGVFGDVQRVVDAFPGSHRLDLAAYLYMKLYLENLVLRKVDIASMAESLEVRAPFLDPEVVAFAAACHPSLKLKGSVTKLLLRRHLARRTPAHVTRRQKKGFGIPLGAWLKGPLKPWLDQRLASPGLDALGIFRPEAIASLVQAHAWGRRDHRKVLWNLAILSRWAERHAHRLQAA